MIGQEAVPSTEILYIHNKGGNSYCVSHVSLLVPAILAVTVLSGCGHQRCGNGKTTLADGSCVTQEVRDYAHCMESATAALPSKGNRAPRQDRGDSQIRCLSAYCYALAANKQKPIPAGRDEPAACEEPHRSSQEPASAPSADECSLHLPLHNASPNTQIPFGCAGFKADTEVKVDYDLTEVHELVEGKDAVKLLDRNGVIVSVAPPGATPKASRSGTVQGNLQLPSCTPRQDTKPSSCKFVGVVHIFISSMKEPPKRN